MNGLNELAVADCPARLPEMETSSLPIPDRIKLPDEVLCRIIEIETRIMATVTIGNNRSKIILSKVVRLIVQLGCRISCRLDTLADFRLSEYPTNELRGSGQPSIVGIGPDRLSAWCKSRHRTRWRE
jgi:hypothetical protein